MSKHSQARPTSIFRTAATALALSMVLLPANLAAQRECITARVDEPIRTPDGSLHPSGPLKLCVSQDYSPVATLHSASISRDSLGLLLSRRGQSEEGVAIDSPVIVFHRQSDGSLLLHAYAVPGRGTTVTYILDRPRAGNRARRQELETGFITAVLLPARRDGSVVPAGGDRHRR